MKLGNVVIMLQEIREPTGRENEVLLSHSEHRFPAPCRKLLGVVEVLLYVHRNRRFIRDGSPGRPPRLSHSS